MASSHIYVCWKSSEERRRRRQGAGAALRQLAARRMEGRAQNMGKRIAMIGE